MIQTQLYWEDREKNWVHFTNIIAQVNKDVDIILLPETFTTGFSMNASAAESGDETLQWMKKMLKTAGSSFYSVTRTTPIWPVLKDQK